ncbi:MAG: Isoleucine--tRNA ligase [Desulfotomaculum sp. 46_296]|nr:MAG: Isoleucine--tRNA ligase [Desulfotomaculum sp. 46_296]HAU31704.1 isoleucine--tRNA ligase [Desulfotomaculum sp.]
MDYSKTLNLPRTDFPMRANLPVREPEILKFWNDIGIYRLVQQKNTGRPKFILHDGPPYANGHIHLGHTLNKILKDIVIKYHSMVGYDAPYVPGWDTHGLPIEQQAIKSLGLNRHSISTVEFRNKCKEYALKFVDIQRDEFKRLGVRGDWDHPYLTLMPHYEAAQIGVFGEMARRGFIYKGLKPVYWCAACETALAEAEVEYQDKHSPSIYVRFSVTGGKGVLPEKDTWVIIWTTTPWTLISNTAICLHPDYEYVLFKSGDNKYLVAKELLENFCNTAGLNCEQILDEFAGRALEGVCCRHPFFGRDSKLVLDTYVTLDAGTGCVHIAPGHGHEDYLVGLRYNLPMLSPIDNHGIFTEEAAQFAGLFYSDANDKVKEELLQSGHLLKEETISHQYPHCWRCKKPILFRATEQWFASVEGFRQDTLDAIHGVRWIPPWGEERICNMVAGRSDWCISRQRTWGVPIPIFYCAGCGKEIISKDTTEHLQKLFRSHGSDVWFAREAEELIPEGLSCPECGGTVFNKENDIMDVWFDSGTSHAGVLEQPEIWPDLRWPADLYLEGSDQYRGWFNSSLSTAIASRGEAPYRAVLTHGFVVDEKGYKMSKSLGNVVDPMKVIKQMGADILRLWVSSTDYRSDLAASPNILNQLSDAYRKIRNTCRFLLGNLYDFSLKTDRVSYHKMPEIDRWALLKLHQLIQRVLTAYSNYDYHVVYHAAHGFCVLDMSALYLDIIKDRLYTSPANSLQRRSAQTVLHETLNVLVRLLVPILAFTSEEIWGYLPKEEGTPVSVQMTDLPEVNEEYLDIELGKKWEKLLEVREEATRILEQARRDKLIGNSLEAAVDLYAAGELFDFLRDSAEELSTLFIVSSVKLHRASQEDILSPAAVNGLAVKVRRAHGEKCERCWMYHEDVGKNAAYPTLCPRCSETVSNMVMPGTEHLSEP